MVLQRGRLAFRMPQIASCSSRAGVTWSAAKADWWGFGWAGRLNVCARVANTLPGHRHHMSRVFKFAKLGGVRLACLHGGVEIIRAAVLSSHNGGYHNKWRVYRAAQKKNGHATQATRGRETRTRVPCACAGASLAPSLLHPHTTKTPHPSARTCHTAHATQFKHSQAPH
jgi:hypothetical protein